MVNKVILVGNLCAAAEKLATSGKAMTKMRVATNARWKDASGEQHESSEFHSVIAFGGLATVCADYGTKGRPVYVEGHLRTTSYDDKEGKRRYSTEIVAEHVKLLGSSAAYSGAEVGVAETKTPVAV